MSMYIKNPCDYSCDYSIDSFAVTLYISFLFILLWLLSKHQIKYYNNKKYYIISHIFHLVQKEIRYFIRKSVIFPIKYALAVFIGKYR